MKTKPNAKYKNGKAIMMLYMKYEVKQLSMKFLFYYLLFTTLLLRNCSEDAEGRLPPKRLSFTIKNEFSF